MKAATGWLPYAAYQCPGSKAKAVQMYGGSYIRTPMHRRPSHF